MPPFFDMKCFTSVPLYRCSLSATTASSAYPEISMSKNLGAKCPVLGPPITNLVLYFALRSSQNS